MTITVVAVLFVPVTQLFSHSIYASADSLDLIVATNLAKTQMEKTINLNFTKAQLKERGDQYFPPLKEDAIEINHVKWRAKQEVIEGTDPLEVRIHVYRESDPGKDVVTLVTLVEDMMWEMVKPVSSE